MIAVAPRDLHKLVDFATVPDLIPGLWWRVREGLRRVLVTVAITHAGHLLPERPPDLDHHVALVNRDLALDLRDEPGSLSGDRIKAKEVFRGDGTGITISEARLQPSPGSWPVIAFL